MPDDATALIAQGIKPTPAQSPDMVGTLSALSQLAYSQANADRARAETGQILQNTQFTTGKLGALQQYQADKASGMTDDQALIHSNLGAWDPPAGKAMLENYVGARDIKAVREGNPNDPNSYAAGGPSMVGAAATAQNTQALTREKNIANMKEAAMLTGHLGNMIVAGADRQQVLDLAHSMAPKLGINITQIDRAARLPEAQWRALGPELIALGQNAKDYMETSGGAEYNKGIAETASRPQKFGVGERGMYPPGAAAAVTGAPVPAFAQPGMTPATPAPAPAAAPSGRSTYTNPTMPIFAQASGAMPGGLTPNGLAKTIQIESRGNPNATNGNAAGLGQFMPGTWRQYGQGSPFDPYQAIMATARYSKANADILTPILGRPPTDAELYLAHQQGPQGALKLLANPNARAGDLVGDAAIRANGGNPNAPASQFTNMWVGKFNGVSPATSITPFQGRTAKLPVEAGGMQGPLTGTTPVPPEALIGPAITGGTFGSPPAPAPQAPAAPATTTPAPSPAATAKATEAPSAAPEMPTIANPGGGRPAPTGTAADAAAPLVRAGPGGSLVVEGTPLAAAEEQREIGKGYGELPQKFAMAADAARQQNAIISELTQSTDGWRQGKFSDWEQEGREILQATAKTLGISSPNLDKATGNYQDFVKLAGNLVRTAVHETTSRSGVQEMQMITRQLPSPEMSQYGLNLVFGQLQGLNDFTAAKQQAASAWRATHGSLGSGPNTAGMDFQTFWNKNASIMPFAIQRIGQQNPEALKSVLDNMAKTPEGIEELKKIKADRAWAITNGLLQ